MFIINIFSLNCFFQKIEIHKMQDKENINRKEETLVEEIKKVYFLLYFLFNSF